MILEYIISILAVYLQFQCSVATSPCEPTWTPFPGGCLRLSNYSKSWAKAFEDCLDHGATLLGPHDFRESDAIFEMEKLQTVHLNDPDFTSREKVNLSLSRQNSCKTIERSGSIKEIDCFNDKYLSICVKRTSLKDTLNAVECAKGFVGFENNCYKMSQEVKNQAEAIKICESLNPLGATLAVIQNERQDSFVKELVFHKRQYIGLVHLNGNGTYGWMDGSILRSTDYSNWKKGEPSSPANNVEPCTEIWIGQWNDCGCSSQNPFVCQVEKYKQPEKNCDFGDGIPWTSDEAYGMCYAILNKRRSWEEAASECSQLGEFSTLASITNPHTNNFIRTHFINNGRLGTYWIGLMKFEMELFWNDLMPVSYMNWKELPETGCATMSLRHGETQWEFANCEKSLYPSICQKRAKNYKEKPLPSPNDCPLGWKRFGVNCFYFSTTFKKFSEAEEYCKGLHRHSTLAIIKDKATNSFIEENVKYAFIGLNDIKTEGSFVWPDGSKLDEGSFKYWAQNEPSSQQEDFDCVYLVDSEGWKSGSCHMTFEFVCSMEYSVCKGNSFVFNNRCFHTSSQKMTCSDAEAYCATTLSHGHLASIHGLNENLVLNNALMGYDDRQWIGLKKAKGVQDFNKWTDGSQLDFLNFMAGHSLTEVDVCGVMEYDGYWYPEQDDNLNSVTCTAKTSHHMRCRHGWVKSDTSCYLLGREKVGFREAQSKCEAKNGYLVQMESKAEIEFIEATFPFESVGEYDSSYEDFWIGLSSKSKEDHYFVWNDGSEISIDNWKGNAVSKNEKCVLAKEERRWGTGSCESKAFYLCESPMEISQIPPQSPAGCKESQMGFESFCYEFFYRMSTQEEADDFCMAQNSELLTIKNREVQNRIVSYLSSLKEDVHLHMMYHSAEDSWVWRDGSYLEFNNWAIGEPNLNIQDEKGLCAIIVSQGENLGEWKSIGCSEKRDIICESVREGYTVPTTTTTTQATMGPEYKCPENFFLYKNRCYYHSYAVESYDGDRSFDDAVAFCEKFGATLAFFESQAAQDDFMVQNSAYGFYIGLRYIPYLSKFVSLDPEMPFGNYEYWYIDEPNFEDSGYCVYAVSNWEMMDCRLKQDFLCVMAPSKDPLTTKAPPTSIPETPCNDSTSHDGWFLLSNVDSTTCYKFGAKDSYLSWFEARDTCISMGGDLISIRDNSHNDFIWAKLNELLYDKNIWIGLNNLVSGEAYHWSDGSVYGYSNWDIGEPNGYIGMEGCVELLTERSGLWNDMHCQIKNNFACSKPRYGSYPTPKPTSAPKGHCKSDLPEFEGHCYTLLQAADWENANHQCIQIGSKVVSIHSERELSFLISRIFPFIEDEESVWTGGNEKYKKGLYQWSDQTPFDYTNWAIHEPNGNVEGHNCITMSTKNDFELGQWFMKSCYDEFSFICKSRVDPTVNQFTYNLPECESNPDFYQYLDSCFLYVSEEKSWRQAQDHCKDMGSNLVSIHDTRHNSFILSESLADVWIGLSNSDSSHPDTLSWMDGSMFDYHKFEKNAAFSPQLQNCIYMDSTSSLWKIDSCNSQRPFICEIKSKSAPTGGDCHQVSGWKRGPLHHCYFFKEEMNLDFKSAAARCKDHGGFLAGIHSQRDNDWVHKELIKHQNSDHHWMGVYQTPETYGSFVFNWMDLEPFLGGYVNWENSDFSNSSLYGAFNSQSGKWVLLPQGSTLNSYICSAKKVYPTQPPHLTTTTSSPVTSSSSHESSQGSNAGATVGIVIGILLGVSLLGGIIFFLGLRSGYIRPPSFWTRGYSRPFTFSNFNYRANPSDSTTQSKDSAIVAQGEA